MTKEDLTLLFDKLNIPYREGIQYMEDNSNYPQIVFFDYRWEDVLSSGSKYDTVVSYQVSFRSMKSRDPKLIELKFFIVILTGSQKPIHNSYSKSFFFYSFYQNYF